MCDCFTKVDEMLAGHGACLNQNLRDSTSRAFVHVIDNGKRKRGQKLPLLQASHCPFCGEKYPDRDSRDRGAQFPSLDQTAGA